MWKDYLMPDRRKMLVFVLLLLIPLPFPVQLMCICEPGGCSCPASMSFLPFVLVSVSSFSLLGSTGFWMAVPFSLISLCVAYYFACLAVHLYDKFKNKKPNRREKGYSPPPLIKKRRKK